jgi:cysteine desulfuration protein SufE
MIINEIQNRIINEFEVLDTWKDKVSYLIAQGTTLPKYDHNFRCLEYEIPGCLENSWLYAEMKNGIVFFDADSESPLYKGILNIFLRVFSGHTPDEIISTDVFVFEKLGLRNYLSAIRINGVFAMLRRIKFYAIELKAKSKVAYPVT